MDEETRDIFAAYYRTGEASQAERAYAWETAIGLQKVDGLAPSPYLIHTAKEHIEGRIDIEEAKALIDSYYEEDRAKEAPKRTEEADKVAARITEILAERSFVFSPAQYMSIHRRLFAGIYDHAGKMRDFNIMKKEWVLDGDTVMYGSAFDLAATLAYDFQVEKDFNYAGLSMNDIIAHLAKFVARLWQIHIFAEGNTRTTAVFFILYLRSLGFDAENDAFAAHSWYFRNALVRANYNNLKKGIRETTSFLELFLRNLLLGEHHHLKSRYLHVNYKDKETKL